MNEVVDARVWSGIHFLRADVHGALIGMQVADWANANYFRPRSTADLIRGSSRGQGQRPGRGSCCSSSRQSSRVGAKTSITLAPSGPAVALWGTFDGMHHVPPGRELALLVADPETHRAAQHEAELLVVVAVLPDDGAGVELDDRDRQPLAVHRAGEDPVPHLLRRQRGGIVEGAHASTSGRKVASPRSGGAP